MKEITRLAIETFLSNIGTNEYNHNHKRRCDLSMEYRQYFLGENIGKSLRKFGELETEQEIKERAKLTDEDNRSVYSMMAKWMDRALRTEPEFKGFVSNQDKTKIEKFNEFIEKEEVFYNLENIYNNFALIDPNLFISCEYDSNNKPCIKYYEGCNVIDLVYDGDKLEAAILKKNDNSFIIMCAGYNLHISWATSAVIGSPTLKYQFLPNEQSISYNGKTITILYQGTNNEYIDGRPIGYKEDIGKQYDCNGNIITSYSGVFVSPFHNSLKLFRGLLQTCSERDITKYLHAFPQSAMLVPKCLGIIEDGGCAGGKNANGDTCKSCRGTGRVLFTNAMRKLEIDFDFKQFVTNNGAQVPDISKMFTDRRIPTESLEYYDNHIEKAINKIYQTTFGNSPNEKIGGAETATKVEFTTEGILDVVYQFVRSFDRDISFIMTKMAMYFDNSFSKSQYLIKHSRDLKIKSREELANELKVTTDPTIRKTINLQLLRIFINNNTEYEIYKYLYSNYSIFNFEDVERKAAISNRQFDNDDIFIYYNVLKFVKYVISSNDSLSDDRLPISLNFGSLPIEKKDIVIANFIDKFKPKTQLIEPV